MIDAMDYLRTVKPFYNEDLLPQLAEETGKSIEELKWNCELEQQAWFFLQTDLGLYVSGYICIHQVAATANAVCAVIAQMQWEEGYSLDDMGEDFSDGVKLNVALHDEDDLMEQGHLH